MLPVDAGHRAVIFDRFSGVKQAIIDEGTHFFIPWVQRPYIYDVRTRPRNVPVATGSKGIVYCNYTRIYITDFMKCYYLNSNNFVNFCSNFDSTCKK